MLGLLILGQLMLGLLILGLLILGRPTLAYMMGFALINALPTIKALPASCAISAILSRTFPHTASLI